ncbi:MAG TPA: GNAT family N-acetyltransferase [Ilumatobacteraceae bacterium]|nr:GNAT family N-acetyltransferase [Ilumatobacteraceae bacterium]
MADATIRLATADDAEPIMEIYNREVTGSTATFDLVPRSLEDQRVWLAARSGAFSAIVAVLDGAGEAADDGGEVVGFASLSPYKERAAYRTTVEDSVYVHRNHTGRGIGRLLLTGLVGIARDSGFHAIIARIEAGGEASRALHAACGFELVGVERQVGRKFGRWLDVAVMQIVL